MKGRYRVILGLFSALFAAVLLVMPIQQAFAYDTSGTCGTNLNWTYDTSTKTLAITGNGAMTDYSRRSGSKTPWYDQGFSEDIAHVTVANGATSLGSYAFYDCKNMQDISLPSSLTSVGGEAFWGCDTIQSITFPKSESTLTMKTWVFDSCASLKTLVLPEGLISAGYSMCNGCTSLESVTIPSTLTELPESAFYGCTSLKNITVPNTVVKFGNNAFHGCTVLTDIALSTNLASLGMNAFSGCTSLAGIVLPDSLTAINTSDFSGCTALRSIVIPDSVTTIGQSAFNGCTALSSVTLGSKVASIDYGAFEGCSSLGSISFPDSLASIGYYAFSGCSAMKSILIPSTVTTVNPHAFNGLAQMSTIYVVGKSLYDTMSAMPSFYMSTDRTTLVYGQLTISPKVGCSNWVQGDLPSVPEVTGNAGGGTVAYSYYSDSACTQGVADIAAAKAGTYYIKADIDAIGDYSAASCTSSFTIYGTDELVNEFSGTGRYETMYSIVSGLLGKTRPSGVIIVTGAAFPDALSAAGLSGLLGYPIVTTPSTILSTSTLEAVRSLIAGNYGNKLDVIVIGGNMAVSDSIANALGKFDADGSVVRIAGAGRIETAEAVYAYGKQAKGWGANGAIVASTANFPDSLSISSYAAAKGIPILLTATDISAQTTADIAECGSAVIVGGTSAVSESAQKAIDAKVTSTRLGGENRYETSCKIIAWELQNGFTLSNVGFTTGTNFPDALSASAYLGAQEGVIALISPNASDNAGLISILSKNASTVQSVSFFGGTDALSNDARTSILDAIGWKSPTIVER